MLRERLKEGDRYHVFPGRQMRRVGKNESHIRLIDTLLNQTWKSFRAVERKFIVNEGTDEESRDGDSDSQASGKEDEKSKPRDRRALRRRQSHLQSRMGMYEAGLSIDKTTYYNTDFWHRVIWWWKRDDIEDLQNSVQRLQIRRVQYDLAETDSLMKRTLAILGAMSGEDPYEDCGEARGPQNPVPGGGGGARRRRSQWKSKAFPGSMTGGNRRSRDMSRSGVREVYEKEIRRTKRRSDSEDSASASQSSPPSPRGKVAGSIVSARSRGDAARRSRAPSVVEYEVVNPGRIWVETVDSGRALNGAQSSSGLSRPRPTHDPSYIRQRPSSGNLRSG